MVNGTESRWLMVDIQNDDKFERNRTVIMELMDFIRVMWSSFHFALHSSLE